MTGSNKMGNLLAKPNKKELAFMKELLEAGKLPATPRTRRFLKVTLPLCGFWWVKVSWARLKREALGCEENIHARLFSASQLL